MIFLNILEGKVNEVYSYVPIAIYTVADNKSVLSQGSFNSLENKKGAFMDL
jgi:hypothetical protein